MKKLNLNNILKVIAIGAIILSLFMFLAPMLSFTMDDGTVLTTYELSGIMLLINDGKASIVNPDNVEIFIENTFPHSEILIIVFSFLFILLTLQILDIFKILPEKYQNILSWCITFIFMFTFLLTIAFPFTYMLKGFDFNISYGAILLMILTGLGLVVNLYLMIRPYFLTKNKQD